MPTDPHESRPLGEERLRGLPHEFDCEAGDDTLVEPPPCRCARSVAIAAAEENTRLREAIERLSDPREQDGPVPFVSREARAELRAALNPDPSRSPDGRS